MLAGSHPQSLVDPHMSWESKRDQRTCSKKTEYLKESMVKEVRWTF